MKDNIIIINRLKDMSSEEIQKILNQKSKYSTYMLKFLDESEKSYYKNHLLKYKLYGVDHSVGNTGGYIYYTTRGIRENNQNVLGGYAIYSTDFEFFDSGKFAEMYDMSDIYPDVIKFEDFDNWLKGFLISIFGIDSSNLYAPRKFIYENMKKVKKYDDFLNEKKIPKISIDIKELISTLDNSKTDIFRTFKINKDEVGVRGDIDKLYSNNGFNNNIKKNDLKNGKLQNTQYSETLLDDKYVLKFFFTYDKTSMVLEEPKFIILQYYNTETDERSDILGFTNTDNINSFYEKLTDSTIELSKGKDTYVYQTSNGGNNWEMKNVQMEDEEMKGTLDKKELQELIDKKKFNVSHD